MSQEFQCAIWRSYSKKWKQKKLQITLTQKNDIKYLLNGKSENIDVQNFSASPEILKKLEKLKYIELWGNSIPKLKKVQQFTVNWKLQKLVEIGGYYTQDGLKLGLWKELSQNYWTKAQVYEIGEYFNNLRTKSWVYIYYDEIIGGGQYNKNGQKDGKWREIDEFSIQSQVFQDGEYKNGKKVGIWYFCIEDWRTSLLKIIGGGQYINQCDDGSIKNGRWCELGQGYVSYSQIFLEGLYKQGKKHGRWNLLIANEKIFNGGGSYDEVNGQFEVKNGRWVEQSDNYSYDTIIYDGEYQNNKKIGRWNILFELDSRSSVKLVGGGTYSFQEGLDSVKNGKWIELHDRFREQQQITYVGEYYNNNKIGRWDTFQSDYWNTIQMQIELKILKNLSGGGSYCEKDFIKIGRWIELSDDFEKSKVTYEGEYKNNYKDGRWDICYYDGFEKRQERIGIWVEIRMKQRFQKCAIFQGEYQDNLKIGQWKKFNRYGRTFQMCENLNYDLQGKQIYQSGKNSQVMFAGEFRNGKKVGRWDTFYTQFMHNPFKLIGGGEYEQVNQGDSLKIGKWNELSDGFYGQSQIIYNGEYKNGNKVGSWDITFRKKENKSFQYIGGGKYVYMEEVGSIKIGKWRELSERFYNGSQVIQVGDYINGQKIGRWNLNFRKDEQDNFEIIGGGLYDINKELGSIKIGSWIELSDGFYKEAQFTYNGSYQNNKKFGKWDIMYRQEGYQFEKIGGGSYSIIKGLDSVKTGKWVELSDGFFSKSQVIFQGEYMNGVKYGKWDILFRNKISEPFNLIGGGSYDFGEKLGSIKNGRWVEQTDDYGYGIGLSEAFHIGEYKQGKKVGRWVELRLSKNRAGDGFKKTVEVNYDN
ncbi:unnamed protein product [Paramecium pentaurelia]|uniref:Uncharacterized protein n=1 Tax=Paramecium pentaurelia TaxID=43138 RepID=A0A8S1U589_9CILI|nr:unnamed protein product [Paramecium pentaurelia]